MPVRKPISGERYPLSARDLGAMLNAAGTSRTYNRVTVDESVRPHWTNLALVKNNTGANLAQFAVIGLGSPVVTPTQNLAQFKALPTFIGATPATGTHEGKIGILREPIRSGKLGVAQVAGIAPVRVTGAAQAFAEITNGQTYLTTAAQAGSASILWAETGASERWALVRIGQRNETATVVRVTSMTPTSGRYPGRIQTAYDTATKAWTEPGADDCWAVTHDASRLPDKRHTCHFMGILASDGKPVFLADKPFNTSAQYVLFILPSALATTDASKASCTVSTYWNGDDPGGTITVYNMPASSNYMFSGASGAYGVAVYDLVQDIYRILQLQC